MLLACLLLAAAPAAPAKPAAIRPIPCPCAAAQPPVTTTASGLRFQTLKPGTGPRPTATDQVLVTYEGHLTDGTLFDASAQPVAFPVAALIPGFTEGLLMMAKGGRYKLWIPAAIGYGDKAAGGGAIPPNSELEFIVTLLDIAPAEAAPAAQ
jgi:FKBP-type peptidyl-prolyl cis-trans isomerase FkpA